MSGIFMFLALVLQIYSFIILARVLMTWIPNLDYSNSIVQALFKITEPVLSPIRNALPQAQGIDFSPMIVLVAIIVLRQVLYGMA